MKLAKALCLVTVLFVLGTIIGCGGESKYVGKYVSEYHVLEINRDGTYRFFETKGFLAAVTTGEWNVTKDGGVETINFIPGYPRGPLSLMKSRKGNNLVSPVSGETFVKKD